MKTLAVIPARYASTRFPGKPLAVLTGKPMVQHVWERCRAAGMDRVIVATEDERIVTACRAFGAEAELTSPGHRSGTDRVAEVASRHSEYPLVVNVQGDEPAIEPATISAVASILREPGVQISTAVAELKDSADLGNPNVVKVVIGLNGDALYFSRAPIPFVRESSAGVRPVFLRHFGIYGFRREVLLEVTALPPSTLEECESLEQLRWLQAGYAVRCVRTEGGGTGVDTPEDLKAVARTFLP